MVLILARYWTILSYVSLRNTAEKSEGSVYLFENTLCNSIPNLSYSGITCTITSGEDEKLISENGVRLYGYISMRNLHVVCILCFEYHSTWRIGITMKHIVYFIYLFQITVNSDEERCWNEALQTFVRIFLWRYLTLRMSHGLDFLKKNKPTRFTLAFVIVILWGMQSTGFKRNQATKGNESHCLNQSKPVNSQLCFRLQEQRQRF